MKIIIEVSGGLVQNVFAPSDAENIEVEVVNLDISDFATKEEEAVVEEKERYMEEIANDTAWQHIY